MTEVSIRHIVVPCPVCGQADPAPLVQSLVDVEDWVPGHYDISLCRGCGQMFLSLRPDDDSLPACYPADYHTRTGRKNFVLRAMFWIYHHFRMKDFEGRTLRSGSVLEIGCGDGQFLSFLEKNWDPSTRFTGLDFSVDDSQLSANSKIKLLCGNIDESRFDDAFDVVIAHNVIEHLPQPVKTLRHIASFMKSGAVIAGQVPDWDSPWRRLFPRHWHGLHIPRHLTFFNQKTLAGVLETAGFSVEQIRSAYDPGDAGVSLCNWITDTLRLKTRPRQAWFFLPVMLLCGPFGLIQAAVLRGRCALRFVARKR